MSAGGEEARRLQRQVRAPWTPEQVESLNGYQASGTFHEYTCGTDSSHGPLTATENGWICEGDEDCAYHQLWAWEWTADGTWEAMRFPKEGDEDERRGASTRPEPKGYSAVLCMKLKVKKTGEVESEGRAWTTIEEADVVSIAFGCQVEHRGKKPGPGDTIFLHSSALAPPIGFITG